MAAVAGAEAAGADDSGEICVHVLPTPRGEEEVPPPKAQPLPNQLPGQENTSPGPLPPSGPLGPSGPQSPTAPQPPSGSQPSSGSQPPSGSQPKGPQPKGQGPSFEVPAKPQGPERQDRRYSRRGGPGSQAAPAEPVFPA